MSNKYSQRVHNALHNLADKEVPEVQELLVEMDIEIDELTAENMNLRKRLSREAYGEF